MAEEQGLLKKSTFETATALKTGGPQAFLKQPAKRNEKSGEYKSCNNYTVCNYNYKNIPSERTLV